MKIQFYAKNVELAPEFKEYIDKKLSKVEKLVPKVLNCQVDLSHDEHHRKGDTNRVEVNLEIPHTKLIRVVEKGETLRAAFDVAQDKVVRRVRKIMDKKKDKDYSMIRKMKKRFWPREY